MSVGISQVNFDAQVLEDEEEAALEKEDQEREEEIRELLNSELDDRLLDDDNASFSSHDLRSSGYSRDTPYSEDFNEHETILNGQDTKTLVPSERGAFERPSLITQRAFHFINGSGQNQSSNTGEANQPYNFDPRHHYEQSYQHPDYYEYRRQENPFDGQVHEYNQDYDPNGGDTNYPTSPDDDVDEGFEQYGGYHLDQVAQRQFPSQQEYHYPQSHYTVGNVTDQNNGSDDHNFKVGHRDYTEGGTQGHGQNLYSNGANNPNDQNNYRMDTPGNYRVQYLAQHEAYARAGGTGSDRHVNEVNSVANGFLEDGSQDVQLQILYKARGRKIEELTRKLESQEEEMTKEIRVLNHQIALMKDEHDGLSTSLEQSQKIVQTCNTELNNLKGQLAAANQQISALQGGKEEVISKLHVAETTIESLNLQLVELSRSESLSRAKEQHESVVNALKKKHEEQVLVLKQKLDETVLSRDYKHEEASQLREELVEKAEMINSLTKTLDSSQRQCQELLKSGTMTEINQLQMALQESSTGRNVAEGQCISLKHELSELKEQVKMYESASRLGVGIGSSIHDNSSFAHLTVRNLNKENWGTPKSHKVPVEETVSELRKELEQCLISNKLKRDQVHDLEKELTSLKDQLKEQQTKAHRMEVIAQEHETKSQELEGIIKEMENDKKEPDEELQKALKDLELARRNIQESATNHEEALREREKLSETCADLKQQMAQMVAEFDEDKRTSIEKCREACLQLHEDAKNLLRDQLNQEHQEIVQDLKKELEENGEELIRIKECYVQLSEDSRGLEHRLKEEFDQEKEILMAECKATLEHELRSSLEKQYTEQLEKERDQWKKEEITRIRDEVTKDKEQLVKDLEEEKTKAVEEALAKALRRLKDEHPLNNNQSDIDDQIAVARNEWTKSHNDELEKRLFNTIGEVRRVWDEEKKLKIKEEIEKLRAELEKAHKESRDIEINQAVELALSHAHSDWLTNDDEMRQREIDQAVEVATTNAVAEAKEEWDREVKSQDSFLQTALAQERHRWQKEMELERSKAVEGAVAIAEVKWLEEEERKISEAVEQALQVARDEWQGSKEREIAVAVEKARNEWNSRKKDEVDLVLESTSTQLVKQFEKQKKEAVEKAVGEARLQWEKRLSEGKLSEIASLRDEIFREFEEQKKTEILETLEEAKEAWVEEAEEQKREEVNEAVAYLEAEYAKSLDEFKHKELRQALEQARKQWTTEELSHREEVFQARLSAAREDWHREMVQSTQAEIDRALSSAREAWVANHEDESDERATKFEKNLRERLKAQFEDEKRQLVDDTFKEAEEKFNTEKRELQEQLTRMKVGEASRAQWQEERTRLEQDHQHQLEELRTQLHTEYDFKLKDQRARLERDLGTRMKSELQKARTCWEKEQRDARVLLENQFEQKTRQALENARLKWGEEQRNETTKQCQDAVKRQQELWASERREKQSALERTKHELATVKKEYGLAIQKLKTELIEERKKATHHRRQDSRMDAAEVAALKADSGSDSSFASVDHMSAARGLEELRRHYLDTIAKIRDDVLDHVNQTKASAAKKIRCEVLKERHSTAKKLRKYYLHCLKQLLDEDRIALENSTSPSSTEDKLSRMAEALRTLSPDKEPSGQSHHITEAVDGIQSPRSGVFKVLRTSSETGIREPSSPFAVKIHGTSRDSGPDGDSDTGPITGKEREFTPILGQRLSVTAKGGFECSPPSGDHFTPERDFGNSAVRDMTTGIPQEIAACNVSSPYGKGAAVVNLEQEKNAAEISADNERQRTYVMHAPSERALKQKPLPSHKRSAPSPAFSVKSYDSDKYTELPTVIHVSKRESSGSKESNSSIPGDNAAILPISDMRSRPSVENRLSKLVSRDKRVNSSPGLPCKPRVDVRTRRSQKS